MNSKVHLLCKATWDRAHQRSPSLSSGLGDALSRLFSGKGRAHGQGPCAAGLCRPCSGVFEGVDAGLTSSWRRQESMLGERGPPHTGRAHRHARQRCGFLDDLGLRAFH